MAKEAILVVEDEEDISELVQYNLRKDGYQADGVTSGEDALRSVKSAAYDLIILDLMLPGVDGLSVCKALKADRATARIPIIMLTAKSEETDIVVGLELGASDYVTKPFSPRVLLARVKAVLRQCQPAEAAPHLARRDGVALTFRARARSSSVVSPIAETTTTTSRPARFAAATRSATNPIRCTSATEDPPYFWTTIPTGFAPRRRF